MKDRTSKGKEESKKDDSQTKEGESAPKSVLLQGKLPDTIPRYGYQDRLYRGSGQPPADTFEKGFKARGRHLDIKDHVFADDRTSGYISTTKSKKIATNFPYKSASSTAFLYEIHLNRPVVDVPKKLLQMAQQGKIDLEDAAWAASKEKESAVRGRIYPSEIKGCWQFKIADIIDEGGDREEVRRIVNPKFKPNPHYAPSSFTEQKIWYVAKATTCALTALGATIDAISFSVEYRKSKSTGDYANTRQEANRIVYSWSGAIMGGSIAASKGALYCVFGTPLASAACAFAFGIFGSMTGYYAGNKLHLSIDSMGKTQEEKSTSIEKRYLGYPTISTAIIEQNKEIREAHQRMQERITALQQFKSTLFSIAQQERGAAGSTCSSVIRSSAENIRALQSSRQGFFSSLAKSSNGVDLTRFGATPRPTISITHNDVLGWQNALRDGIYMYSAFAREKPPQYHFTFSGGGSGGGGGSGMWCDSSTGICYSYSGSGASDCRDSSSSQCRSSLKF